MTPDSPPPITLSPELVEGSKGRRAYRRLRVPAFYPVPTRTSRDGWTIERQADFLGLLAETGSVLAACEAVGMSRKSAYQLRARHRAESFAAAWDAALGAPRRKVTVGDLQYLAVHGLIRLKFFRGRYCGPWRIPDVSAHLRWLAKLDRQTAGMG